MLLKTGVILAAGAGRRMESPSEVPKALLPVGGKPLIDHHVEQMARCGIQEIFVVVGCGEHHVREHLGDGSRFGVQVVFARQSERLGSAHAVGILEPLIHGNFLLFLGDIAVTFAGGERGLVQMAELATSAPGASVLATRRETDLELVRRNFSVECGEGNRVLRVVEKPIQPDSNLKGCGVYLFSKNIFTAARSIGRNPLRGEFELTDAIQELILRGCPVFSHECVEWDCNVNGPDDLARAKARFAR